MFLSLSKVFLKIVNKERADLNVQASSRANVLANVCQGSILDPLFFFIYINNLSDDVSSNPKLFANDTSLFSGVPEKISNNDLQKMRFWAHQWKVSFKPDPLKQPQEQIFFAKASHPALLFKNNQAKRLHRKNILE